MKAFWIGAIAIIATAWSGPAAADACCYQTCYNNCHNLWEGECVRITDVVCAWEGAPSNCFSDELNRCASHMNQCVQTECLQCDNMSCPGGGGGGGGGGGSGCNEEACYQQCWDEGWGCTEFQSYCWFGQCTCEFAEYEG